MTDLLTFECPTCSVKLTVPNSMAGVSGPCPSCGVPITAPLVSQTYFEGERGPFRVEPRHSRPRPVGSPEVVSRPMPEQDPDARSHSGKMPPRQKDPKRFFRVVISLLVLAAMVGVSYALHAYLRAGAAKPAGSSQSTVRRILPDEETPAPTPPPADLVKPALPINSASTAANAVPAPAVETPAPTIAALELLQKFFGATTLEERLPLIETNESPAALAASVLAGPFPPRSDISPEIQETNVAGKFTDMFYTVHFTMQDGKALRYVILVRMPVGGEPKVVVDPFLDTFGGRLAAYAESPSDKPATFQVIVSPVARCYDKGVPNREQKLTLKLLPRDNEKEITNAYFNRLSRLGEMLQDDTSGLRYGQARTARITLQWNTQENPGMPFLEALSIKDFRWNP